MTQFQNSKQKISQGCAQCHYQEQVTTTENEIRALYGKIAATKCPKCESIRFKVEDEMDLIENLGDIAEAQGTKIELLSDETEEGISLFYTFGGIAAILRFKI